MIETSSSTVKDLSRLHVEKLASLLPCLETVCILRGPEKRLDFGIKDEVPKVGQASVCMRRHCYCLKGLSTTCHAAQIGKHLTRHLFQNASTLRRCTTAHQTHSLLDC